MTWGWGRAHCSATRMEGGPVPPSVEARVSALLDQLENPNLSEREIARIKEKIELLRTQDGE